MWIERLRAEWAGRYCALANSGSLHCGGSLSLLAGPSEPREPLRNAAAMPYQTLAALNRYARGPPLAFLGTSFKIYFTETHVFYARIVGIA